MSSVTRYLSNILKGGDLCILCFNEVNENSINLIDEIVMKFNCTKSMKDLISFILGEEEGVCRFNTVCIECTKSAINCYTFIETVRTSHSTLYNAISNITETVPVIEEDTIAVKAMYITLEKNNLECNVSIDRKKTAKTPRKVIKRLKSLTRKKRRIKKAKIKVEVDHYGPVSPEVVDIIHDPYNNTYTCGECLKLFRRSNNLRSHYLRVHAPKDFKCLECSRKFGSAYLLKQHQSESHITAICSDCGKTYDNIHSLKIHMASHEDKICPTCGKHYKNINSFKRHLKLQACGVVHSTFPYNTNKDIPDYRYECDVCNKRFTQKGSLRVHIKFEHENGKAYVCNWCDKKFSAQSKLNAHIVKHTRERNFTCEICGGKFVTKEALLYHTRIHTGEKPYPCPQCDERFLSASRRMEHLRRKHWGPTLVCEICSSRFKTSFCLKKHKLRHFDPNSRLFSQKCPDADGIGV